MSEDERLKKRFLELANKSYSQGIYTFTEFLGLNEQSIFSEIEKEIQYVGISKFGGTIDAERIMIRFGDVESFGYSVDYPVVCLCIKPLMKKFADDLNHRDFLGALMNLGITREKLGDIIIHDNEGYLFCDNMIAPYIMENLTRVKHTSVTIVEEMDREKVNTLYKDDFKSCIIIVDSKRIDAIIAKTYKISRSISLEFFKARKVFVNGKVCTSNSQLIKEGDIVSVRGKGRFKFLGNESESKKGRIRLEIWK